MLRFVIAALLAVSLLFSGLGDPALSASLDHDRSILLSGRLEYESQPGPPHYLLQGYVLLHDNAEQMANLLNREVLVIGTVVTGPTIYMTRVVQVDRVSVVDSGLLPAPGDDTAITIPILPPEGENAIIIIKPIRPIHVKLRGREVYMDQPPVIGNGRTLVGLRAIAEALDASVSWDPATRGVTVTQGQRTIQVTIGSPVVTITELGTAVRQFNSDITPVIVGDRTQVPLRLIAESLGLKIHWEAASSTVFIN